MHGNFANFGPTCSEIPFVVLTDFRQLTGSRQGFEIRLDPRGHAARLRVGRILSLGMASQPTHGTYHGKFGKLDALELCAARPSSGLRRVAQNAEMPARSVL